MDNSITQLDLMDCSVTPQSHPTPTRWKKKCIGCKEIKDIQEFAEDKSRPDGHEYYCKDCRREHQRNKYAKEILQKGVKYPNHYALK
jgi:hypothetical protein